MKINVHAGHNPDGKIACGAIGFIQESTEARRVKDEVISQLRMMGYSVYDCTCENGTSQSNVLTKIVNACNERPVDLDISIHFNAGAKDEKGNGKTTGVEVYTYGTNESASVYAKNICEAISALGFKNRGVKVNKNLYFLRKTKSPAILIECCFVDDKDDIQIYDYRKMANAIVRGIAGDTAEDIGSGIEDEEAKKEDAETKVGNEKQIYRVQVGAYSVKENAENMQKTLESSGFDAIIVKA